MDSIDIVDYPTRSSFLNKCCCNKSIKGGAHKILYLITGGIATGKSVVSYNFIRNFGLQSYPYVSSDSYYQVFFHKQGSFEEEYNQARQYTDDVLNELLVNSATFVWETVLSKEKKHAYLMQCVASGYKIICIFVGVDNLDITQQRSLKRANEGFHYVPSDFIADRYSKSLDSMEWLINLSDVFVGIDTTYTPTLTCYKDSTARYLVDNPPTWLRQYTHLL
ncbi:MAG: hypothetical protein J1F65_02670 [Clostridiales bacterium]|nr:hypothetical protein [Clostridiales bacterium]